MNPPPVFAIMSPGCVVTSPIRPPSGRLRYFACFIDCNGVLSAPAALPAIFPSPPPAPATATPNAATVAPTTPQAPAESTMQSANAATPASVAPSDSPSGACRKYSRTHKRRGKSDVNSRSVTDHLKLPQSLRGEDSKSAEEAHENAPTQGKTQTDCIRRQPKSPYQYPDQ